MRYIHGLIREINQLNNELISDRCVCLCLCVCVCLCVGVCGFQDWRPSWELWSSRSRICWTSSFWRCLRCPCSPCSVSRSTWASWRRNASANSPTTAHLAISPTIPTRPLFPILVSFEHSVIRTPSPIPPPSLPPSSAIHSYPIKYLCVCGCVSNLIS